MSNIKKPAKALVTEERDVYTYSELWHASDCMLKDGIEDANASSWKFLSSIVLTAFSFEAYLNHVGIRTIKSWDHLERLPPWSKFELLCETLNVSFSADKAERPLQTIQNLLNFRNTIAHGSSEKLNPKPEIRDSNEQLDCFIGERPLTHWERLIQTKDFAERVREDTKKVLEKIHDARKDVDKEYLFNFGMGFSSAYLIQNS